MMRTERANCKDNGRMQSRLSLIRPHSVICGAPRVLIFRRASAIDEPMSLRLILTSLLIALASPAPAQDKGSVDPKPLPPLANPDDPKLGAKELFGRKLLPAAMP